MSGGRRRAVENRSVFRARLEALCNGSGDRSAGGVWFRVEHNRYTSVVAGADVDDSLLAVIRQLTYVSHKVKHDGRLRYLRQGWLPSQSQIITVLWPVPNYTAS